ncbi:MAG: MlaD family protein [Mariprofundaceae bacterium]|nr:MlaD family protein [Mariprofundaceae bacterium]
MVERDDVVSSMRRQVGWFVILGVGALVLVLLVASMRSNVFAKKFYIFFSPPSAASFYEGQPVKFQGFAIGRVDQIELQEEGKVRITMELIDRYRNMLHQDAIVRVTKEGLIGEQVVEVTAGDENKPAINDGALLGYETEASLDQLLADLKPAVGNANVLLSELASLAKWMNDPKGDVRLALSGVREVTQGVRGDRLEVMIEQLTGTLVHLQKFAEELNQQQVAHGLSSSLKEMTAILHDIRPFSEAMGKEGGATVEHVNAMLRNLDMLSKSLDIVASDLSELTPELPGLARESRTTIEEINRLVKNLQGSWLIGGDKGQGSKGGGAVAAPALDLRP